MGLFEIATILIVLTALFSYVNHHTLRLPTTIGVMLIALAISLTMGVTSWGERVLKNLTTSSGLPGE